MDLRVCGVVWGLLLRGCWGDLWGVGGLIRGRGGLLGQIRRNRRLRVGVALGGSSGRRVWKGRIENCFGMRNSEC